MDQAEQIAREEIRQTITNYTIAGDRRDAALFNGQWAEEALFEFGGFPPVPGFRCEGLGAIRDWTAGWAKLRHSDDPTLRSATFARHNLTTCHIEMAGPDAAAARTFFFVVTDIGPDHSGTYDDRLVRRGGRWLFAHRRVALDWRSADSIYPAVRRA
jgi:hypothetical protein